MHNTHSVGRVQHRIRRAAGRGLTMIELLVALLLGLITTFFISQVFALYESQKRTATFGTDAQVNGAVALHTLRQHLIGSGYGVIAAGSALGCPLQGRYGTAGSTVATPPITLAPVLITPGASASAPSDTVAVLASNKSSFSAPVMVKPHRADAEARFEVVAGSGTLGYKSGDSFAAIPADWQANANKCLLFTVNADPGGTGPQLDSQYIPHVPSPAASSWNAGGTSDWPVGATGAQFPEKTLLVNFGQIRQSFFSVSDDGSFQVQTWTPEGYGGFERLNSGIVLMKALYGRDTSVPADGTVDVYDTTSPTNTDEWSRLVSVRLVMVARSGHREKDEVTTAEPTWNVGGGTAVDYRPYAGGGVTACGATATSCDLPLPISQFSDWRHYRYKVFETAVPLRNLMWNAEEE